jgi:GAF domain-containing protein
MQRDPLESQWQTAVLYAGTLFYGVTRLLFVIVDRQAADPLDWSRASFVGFQLVMLISALVVWQLIRSHRTTNAARLLVVMLLIGGTLFVSGDPWYSPLGLAEFGAALVISGLLLASHERWATAGYIVIACGLGNFIGTGENTRLYLALAMWVLALAVIFDQAARRPAAASLDKPQSPERDQNLAELSGEIAKGLFSRIELDTFLGQIADSIQQRFASIYHVQIFLIEPESPRATLRAATGPVGQQLLDQEYQLDVGGLSAVGRSALMGIPVVITDLPHDPIYKAHPLLPETHSQLVIPFRSQDEVTGVLDLHAVQTSAFDDTDIAFFKAAVTNLSMAVDSIHWYESAQRNMRENQALYQQTQAGMHEIERLNYQLTGRAWTDYLRQQSNNTALSVDLDTGQVTPDAEWTESLKQAASKQQVIASTNVEDQQVISLPIVVRGEVIGAMEFEIDAAEMPDGVTDLVSAVGQRLGLAMENRRLFDETQRIAQREAMINDIGAELQAATGVDAIIQRAARHLQDVLAAQQVTIRLGTQEKKRQ